MPGQPITTTNKPYLRIVSGNWARTVDAGTEGAKLREYKLDNGQTGSKWELLFQSWTGKIKKIEFKDSGYGEMCNIHLDDAVLTLNTQGRYFSDMAIKLPNADLAQDITFHPYDFEIDGVKRKGISLQQNGEKLTSAFWDGKKTLHGFPEVDEEKKVKKTYWKLYFAERTEFLIDYLKKIQMPQTLEEKAEEIEDVMNEKPGINDLPF